MSAPFSTEGTLNLPGAPGLSADPLPFGFAGTYDAKASFEYLLPVGVPGTKTVDFGSIPTEGAKVLLVVLESVDDQTPSPPILITLNGGNQPVEVTAGGFLCVGNPVPVDGITSMVIAYTDTGKVRVWLLG